MGFSAPVFTDGSPMENSGFATNVEVALNWINSSVGSTDIKDQAVDHTKIYPPTVLESPINSYEGTFQSAYWSSTPDTATYWNKLTDRIDVFRTQWGTLEKRVLLPGMSAFISKDMDFDYDEDFPLVVLVQADISIIEAHRKTPRQDMNSNRSIGSLAASLELVKKDRGANQEWEKFGVSRVIRQGQYKSTISSQETGLDSSILCLRDRDRHEYSLMGGFAIPESGAIITDTDVALSLSFYLEDTYASQFIIGPRFLKVEVFRGS